MDKARWVGRVSTARNMTPNKMTFCLRKKPYDKSDTVVYIRLLPV